MSVFWFQAHVTTAAGYAVSAWFAAPVLWEYHPGLAALVIVAMVNGMGQQVLCAGDEWRRRP